MPVVRRRAGTSANRAGVYAAVRERVEADAAHHAAWCAGWANQPPYNLQRVLDALRAGRPTDAPAALIPKRYWADHCRYRGTRTGAVGDAPLLYMAIVHPDDTVTFEPDDGSAMIEYLGV